MKNTVTNKIYLTAILMFIGGYFIQAQGIVENYFPKLPDAASLSKTIDIPSGNYSGTASFYIPLYEFDFDGIKVPIGINYQTTGIKVQEIASRVGLGWSLDLFGVSLSGQIMGKRDFLTRNDRMIHPSSIFRFW